nr:xylulokinase [bacterium]
MYLMGIDIGTSGTKCALFDEKGKKIASHTGEYPLYQPQNGYAEQQPEDWWRATVDGIRAVLQKSGIDAGQIAGIGLSGQMHGLVMLDGDGRVLRPAILWCDGRTQQECAELTQEIGAGQMIAITANPALPGFTAGKIRWVQKHEPDVFARCKTILLPKDYIRYRLTGTFATEVSDASGMQLMNIEKRRWAPEMLRVLHIHEGMLGSLHESVEISAHISGEAARLTGLKAGTPVCGGAGDNAAAAVGTGVVADGRAFATIGTSGVVYAHASRMALDQKGRVHTFCSAVPGQWHVMAVTQAAGLSLRWLRDTCCAPECAAARDEGVDPYDIMTREAATSPIGANRLVYLPYLMGERTPHLDTACRGVFFGLSAMHTRSDLIRSVMEGVSFSLTDGVDIMRGMGLSIEGIMACGGGAASPLWRQMLADLWGCTVHTASSSEGAALGVAILAGVGCGLYQSVPAACDALIGSKESTSPDAKAHRAYQPYLALYRSLYPALKPSFDTLATL